MEEYENTENIETSQSFQKKLVLNFWKLFSNQNDSPLPSESAQISMEFPPHLLVCSPAVCPQSLAASQRRSIAAFQGLLKTACSSAASRCSRSSKDCSADEDKPHTTAAREILTQFNMRTRPKSSHQLLTANHSSNSKKVQEFYLSMVQLLDVFRNDIKKKRWVSQFITQNNHYMSLSRQIKNTQRMFILIWNQMIRYSVEPSPA